LIDVAAADARRTLHALSATERWPLHPLPGMRAHPLAPGPGHPDRTAILACFAPTSIVPRHHHAADECILVFQGAFETDDKHIVRAGDELHSPAGSSHAVVRFLGGVDCLCAIITGEGAGADAPRPAPAAEGLSGVAR
jgi:anti-sigma factor ChrR (cupin superfamily)